MAALITDLFQHRGLFLMILVLGIGGSFQYGFHISVLNSPSPLIKEFINTTWIHRYSSPINDSGMRILWTCIVSSYCIGGIVGTMGSGYLASRYGKKKCHLFSDLIPIAAALLIGCSNIAKSFELILISRILFGINAGIGLSLHPQYAGEIAPKHLRGFTNTTISLFVTSGKLFGQVFGLSQVLGIASLWPLLLALSGVWALVQLVTLPLFPESPPYLLMEKEDKEGCMRALNQLWGERDHQVHIDEMLKEQAARKNVRSLRVMELLREPLLRWQLYMLIALVIALQLCGVNAIYFYASEVFLAANFQVSQVPYLTIGVGVCETVSVLLCSMLVDRFGRRILLLWGYGIMVGSLALLTVSISLQERFTWLPICSVLLIFIFVLSFGAGPGATTVTIVVEIFTQESRSAAFMILGVINWVGLLAIGMLFPFVAASIGHFCFLIFLFVIAACGIFLFCFLPETKGKSWLEIKEDFDSLNLRGLKSSEISSNDIVVSTKF
ncbi:solute carrier family 2, facilitated glucose transporter member 9-like [Discoglossus pictus]